MKEKEKDTNETFVEMKIEIDANKGLVRLPLLVQKTISNKENDPNGLTAQQYRDLGLDHKANELETENVEYSVVDQWISYWENIACLIYIEDETPYTEIYYANGFRFKVCLTSDDLLEVFATCTDIEDSIQEDNDMSDDEYDNEANNLYNSIH